jgi:PDDEXK-like domain of unknown function (DUF3799)
VNDTIATFHDVSAAEYHKDQLCQQPSLSSHIANILLKQSPLHAWLAHPRLNPNFVREEDSRFDLGSAAHSLLLERNEAPIVWCDFDDWRKNEAKAQRDAARAAGKLPVLSHYKPALFAMVKAAHDCIERSELRGILDTGRAEQTLVWQEKTGLGAEDRIWCRARLDLISEDRRVILDYKSTTDAHPEVFGRQIGRMGYELQSAFYTRALTCTGNITHAPPTFVFLAQEITPPFACSLIGLSNSYCDIGYAKYNAALNMWSDCLTSDEWPGYGSRIMYVEPMPWQLAAIETEDAV